MTRRVVLAACLLAAACARKPEPAAGEIAITVRGAPATIACGEGFTLTVVRSFGRDLEPEPWNDAALAPLVIRSDFGERRENEDRIDEIRTLRAYAFEPGTVTVPPLLFRATPKRGGPARLATAPGFTIAAKTTLDPKKPGPPEAAGPPPPEPHRFVVWIAAAALGLAALATLVRSRRTIAAPAPGAAPSGPSPFDVARARLARLRALDPRTHAEIRAWHIEAASTVRDWLAATLAVPALEMTTEEIAASAIPTPVRSPAAEVLGACDDVKFGDHAATAAERGRLLEAAGDAIESRP